jgi:hypothetical protein
MFDGPKLGRESPPQASRSPFDGLILSKRSTPDEQRSKLESAVQRVGRATADILRYGREHEPLPHQKVALDNARKALDTVQPRAAQDLAAAFAADPALVDDAAKGRTTAAIRAMQLEAEVRTNPELRADRFVQSWQQLRARHEKLGGWQNEASRKSVEQAMTAMGKSLERDPQLESLLRTRVKQLGLPGREDQSLSQSISDWLGRSRSRGIGL